MAHTGAAGEMRRIIHGDRHSGTSYGGRRLDVENNLIDKQCVDSYGGRGGDIEGNS